MSSQLSPAQVRNEFRCNTKKFTGTGGLCPGYLQASSLLFPSSFADDFERFCKMNSAPLPLLYRSGPGQFDAPPLAKHSDVRTDVGLYSIFENGNFVKNTENLSGLNLSDMVTFYIGCSYGFEEALVKNGIHLAHYRPGGCVGTYLSGINNYPVGRFGGTMVVTMRPIKRQLLEAAYNITGGLEGAHGAPIHIGDPELIGVNLRKPLLGSTPDGMAKIADDEVPVFWGCGTTACIACITGKPPIYIGQWEHSVAFVFIADIKSEDYFTGQAKTQVNSKIIQLTEKPLFMSALSQQAWRQITALDCSRKDGEGIKEQEYDLVKVALTLSHSSSVAITTTLIGNQNEVVAILRAVATVKKNVQLLVPDNKVITAEKMLKEAKSRGTLDEPVQLVSLQEDSPEIKAKGSEILLIMYPDCTVYRAPDFAAQNQSAMFNNLVKLPPGSPKVVEVQRFGIQAVAMALFHLNNCPVHSRYVRRGRGVFSPIAVDQFVYVA